MCSQVHLNLCQCDGSMCLMLKHATHSIFKFPSSTPQAGLIPMSDTHLKRAPEGEGEGALEVPFFCAPALSNFVVTNQHLLAPVTEAGVDVEGDVIASQEVHREPAGDQSSLRSTVEVYMKQTRYI